MKEHIIQNSKTLLTLILISVTCCNSESDKYAKQNLEFKINYKLLNSEAITDKNGFSMNIPVDWKPLDSLLKSQIKRAVNSQEGGNKLEIVNVFQSKSGSQCIISKVITNKKDFSFISENIIYNIQLKIQGDGYKTNDLNINNLRAKQYLVRGKDYVIIKLYIQIKEFYQIDFIIPLSKYDLELESIESSIGTIMYKGN